MTDIDYKPVSEDEAVVSKKSLMPAGEYEGFITVCEPQTSSKGKPMLFMKVDVYDDKGEVNVVWHWLTLAEGQEWRLRHCARSAGLLKEYEAEKLASAMLIDKNVRVEIEVRPESVIPEDKLNGKPPGSKWDAGNSIKDFLPRKESKAKAKASAKKDDFEDDIPF